MRTPVLPSDFLGRLRRSFAVSGVLFLALTAAGCGDDDDDGDGGTGPSAACIDEIDYALAFFTDDDVQTLEVGQTRNGNISTSDVEADFQGFIFYYDIYAVGIEEDGDYTLTVNPSGDFDADVSVFTTSGQLIDYADDEEDAGATEILTGELVEGCYVIGVSSPNPEMTGAYSVRLE